MKSSSSDYIDVCADNDAKILTSFTPLDGHTPTVGKMLKGAQTIKTLPTDPDLLPDTPDDAIHHAAQEEICWLSYSSIP